MRSTTPKLYRQLVRQRYDPLDPRARRFVQHDCREPGALPIAVLCMGRNPDPMGTGVLTRRANKRYMSRVPRLDPTAARRATKLRETRRRTGLRLVQFWAPDTRTRAFAAQVAHDLAILAEHTPDEGALLDAFERMAIEDWPE